MEHTVRQGECLSSIAAKYGMRWATIWNHADNSALRNKRQDPNVLFPGDVVKIPSITPAYVTVGTETHHTFRLTPEKTAVHVRLALGGAPAKDEDFIAEFRGQRIEGKTDGDGVLTLELSASVTAIELTLPKRNTQFMLRVGHLDPADTPQGSIARLRNLNIAQLTQSETLSEPLRAALKDFQRAHAIDETGELDDKTVDALKKTHGC